MLLEGIYVPLTTPFHADGRIYPHKLESNVERYSRAPLAGMVVLGHSAEADGLTDDEQKTILTTAIQTAAHEKVMLAAIGRESVYATLQMAEFAGRAGYDAVVLRSPLAVQAASMHIEQLTFFRAVADGSALPVILDSTPDRPLSVETVAALAHHPHIIGLIDSFASPEHIASMKAATAQISREVTVTPVFAAVTERMLRAASTSGSFVSAATLGGGTATALEAKPALKTRTKRVGFQLLAGPSAAMLGAWQAGAAGSVPAFAACAPQATCEVWQAFRDGDPPLAEEKQERLRHAAALVEDTIGIGMLKYASDWNGYFGGRPRLPLLPPTAGGREQTERALAGMRN